MTKQPIELIVFDMDGVLAQLDHARRLDALSGFTGKSAAFIHRAIFASDFETSAEAGAYATGTEYLAEFNRRIDGALLPEQWIAARKVAMKPIQETIAIARSLKGRVMIAALTNNGSLLKESIAAILPAAAEVFGASFHASYEFGARKPEPCVFERLVRHYGIGSHRAVFIDDNASYLEGAKSAGLHPILFTTPMRLSAELAAFKA